MLYVPSVLQSIQTIPKPSYHCYTDSVNIRKIFILFLGIPAFFALMFVGYIFLFGQTDDSSQFAESVYEPRDLLDPFELLYDEQVSISPDGRTYAFVTYENEGMANSKVYISERFGGETTLVASEESYSYYSSPVWNEDGTKIAFAKLFPFELWTVQADGSELTLIYSETEQEEIKEGSNFFFPSIGYGGKIDLAWRNNSIVFENTKEYPREFNAIDTDSRLVTRLDNVADIPERVLGAANGTKIEVTTYSQRDDIWEDIQLGGCEGETLASAGCAVTSVAMLLDAFGAEETDPEELNGWFTDTFEKGYFNGCDIRWNVVPNFAEGVKLKGVFFNAFDLTRVDHELALGNLVVVGWNNVAFTPVPHWALITAKIDGQFYANDPWTGELQPLRYFGNNFDHMVVYERDN